MQLSPGDPVPIIRVQIFINMWRPARNAVGIGLRVRACVGAEQPVEGLPPNEWLARVSLQQVDQSGTRLRGLKGCKYSRHSDKSWEEEGKLAQ